jgi:hypothetical protein
MDIRQSEERGKCLLERLTFPENLIALLSIGKSRLMLAGKVNLSRKSSCTAEEWKSRVMPAAKVYLRRKFRSIALEKMQGMRLGIIQLREIRGDNSRNRGSCQSAVENISITIASYAALIQYVPG